jgi:hypothetical protein
MRRQLVAKTFLPKLTRFSREDRLSVSYGLLWAFFSKHRANLKQLRLNAVLLVEDFLANEPAILDFLCKVRDELNLK